MAGMGQEKSGRSQQRGHQGARVPGPEWVNCRPKSVQHAAPRLYISEMGSLEDSVEQVQFRVGYLEGPDGQATRRTARVPAHSPSLTGAPSNTGPTSPGPGARGSTLGVPHVSFSLLQSPGASHGRFLIIFQSWSFLGSTWRVLRVLGG